MKTRGNNPKLTEKESEIMAMLWEKGPMFVREMVELYPEPRPHFNTVSTTVRILQDKGYVSHEVVGSSYKYFAVASREDFADHSLAQIIRNYFRGSASAVVSSLVEKEQLSVDDLKEIIDMIEHKSKK